MAGAPKDNQNAVKGFKAKQALEIALNNNGETKVVISSMQCLVDIWNKQIALAREGSPASANMIMDRLDGKPGQSIDLGPDTTVHFHLDYKNED
jgi:hypothetical protein